MSTIKGSELFNIYSVWNDRGNKVRVIGNGEIIEGVIEPDDIIQYEYEMDCGIYDDSSQIPLINRVNPMMSAKRISGERDVRLVKATEYDDMVVFEYEII